MTATATPSTMTEKEQIAELNTQLTLRGLELLSWKRSREDGISDEWTSTAYIGEKTALLLKQINPGRPNMIIYAANFNPERRDQFHRIVGEKQTDGWVFTPATGNF